MFARLVVGTVALAILAMVALAGCGGSSADDEQFLSTCAAMVLVVDEMGGLTDSEMAAQLTAAGWTPDTFLAMAEDCADAFEDAGIITR